MICGGDAEPLPAPAAGAGPATAHDSSDRAGQPGPIAQGAPSTWTADFNFGDAPAAPADSGPTVALAQAPAPAMDLLDLDFSPAPVPTQPLTSSATPGSNPVAAAVASHAALLSVSAPAALLTSGAAPGPEPVTATAAFVTAPTSQFTDLDGLAFSSEALGTAPATQFMDLDGLAFSDEAPRAQNGSTATHAASDPGCLLGDQLREAVLSGSKDGLQNVFDAAAHAEAEARTTTGDRLREALLHGSSDQVSALCRQFSPPQRREDPCPFQAAVSAQDLSRLGAHELQGLQQMVAQALQAKHSQELFLQPSADAFEPLGEASLAPDGPMKEGKQFNDLLMAFHEKHPITGLEGANVN